MKPLKLILAALCIGLLGLITAVYSELYYEKSAEEEIGRMSIKEDLKTEIETVCRSGFDKDICFDNITVHLNGKSYKIKDSAAGYVVKEKVYAQDELEKEENENSMYNQERESPFDRIKDEQIRVYDNRVVIDVPHAKWRNFIDSNSMDPLIDIGTNTIEIKPKSPDEIQVGDIIAYNVEGYEIAIVHRVAERGRDDAGAYFITKGDNLKISDGEKIRFEQLEGVVIGVLY